MNPKAGVSFYDSCPIPELDTRLFDLPGKSLLIGMQKQRLWGHYSFLLGFFKAQKLAR